MPAPLINQLTAIEDNYDAIRKMSSFDSATFKQLNDFINACLNLTSDAVFLYLLKRTAFQLIEYVGGYLLKEWHKERINFNDEKLKFLNNVGLLNIKIALSLQLNADVDLVKTLVFFNDNNDVFNILISILINIHDLDGKLLENIHSIFDAISHFEHNCFSRETENKFLLLNNEIEKILLSDEYEQYLRELATIDLQNVTPKHVFYIGTCTFSMGIHLSCKTIDKTNNKESLIEHYLPIYRDILINYSKNQNSNSLYCVIGIITYLINYALVNMDQHKRDEELLVSLLTIVLDEQYYSSISSTWINNQTILIDRILSYILVDSVDNDHIIRQAIKDNNNFSKLSSTSNIGINTMMNVLLTINLTISTLTMVEKLIGYIKSAFVNCNNVPTILLNTFLQIAKLPHVQQIIASTEDKLQLFIHIAKYYGELNDVLYRPTAAAAYHILWALSFHDHIKTQLKKNTEFKLTLYQLYDINNTNEQLTYIITQLLQNLDETIETIANSETTTPDYIQINSRKSSSNEDSQDTTTNDFRYRTTDDITQKQDEEADDVDENYGYQTITRFKSGSPTSQVDNHKTITRQNAEVDRLKSSLVEDAQDTRRNDFRYHTTDDITQNQDEEADDVNENYDYQTITRFKSGSPRSYVENDTKIIYRNADVDRREGSLDEEVQDTRTNHFSYRTTEDITQTKDEEADDVDENYDYQTTTRFKSGSPTSYVENDTKITYRNADIDRREGSSVEDAQDTRTNHFSYRTTEDITQKQDEKADDIDENYGYQTITRFKSGSPTSQVDNQKTIMRQTTDVDRRKSLLDEEAQDTRTNDFRYRTNGDLTQKEDEKVDDVDENYGYATIIRLKPGAATSRVDNHKTITDRNADVDRRKSSSVEDAQDTRRNDFRYRTNDDVTQKEHGAADDVEENYEYPTFTTFKSGSPTSHVGITTKITYWNAEVDRRKSSSDEEAQDTRTSDFRRSTTNDDAKRGDLLMDRRSEGKIYQNVSRLQAGLRSETTFKKMDAIKSKVIESETNEKYQEIPLTMWTNKQVVEWCKDNGLTAFGRLLVNYDGKSIIKLYELSKQNSSKTIDLLKSDYQRIANNEIDSNQLSVLDIIHFQLEVEKYYPKRVSMKITNNNNKVHIDEISTAKKQHKNSPRSPKAKVCTIL
ncbi:unnamed protein product [Didymodactylos carnosus]|uniref:Uncharacterized protein n=1 Tax=Didymodactylos carnosus TaxID=1234261 RepID=A0A8S2EJD0_9BILA|nr:unnamed protein product [Didymodactylos carnosus]CAF4048239.1 unnamed protein product [Didymodactylos carnosus]